MSIARDPSGTLPRPAPPATGAQGQIGIKQKVLTALNMIGIYTGAWLLALSSVPIGLVVIFDLRYRANNIPAPLLDPFPGVDLFWAFVAACLFFTPVWIGATIERRKTERAERAEAEQERQAEQKRQQAIIAQQRQEEREARKREAEYAAFEAAQDAELRRMREESQKRSAAEAERRKAHAARIEEVRKVGAVMTATTRLDPATTQPPTATRRAAPDEIAPAPFTKPKPDSGIFL